MLLKIEAFRWEKGDPFAEEHRLLEAVISHSLKLGYRPGAEIDLTATREGVEISKFERASSARLVMALAKRGEYLQQLRNKAWEQRAAEKNAKGFFSLEESLMKADLEQAITVRLLAQTMRRTLPLTREHFIALLNWFSVGTNLMEVSFPTTPMLKALSAFGPIDSTDKELREGLKTLRVAMAGFEPTAKLALKVDEVLAKGIPIESIPVNRGPVVEIKPARAGGDDVLVDLKQFLGLLPRDATETERMVIGTDHFPMRNDSSLVGAHEQINIFLSELTGPNFEWRKGLEESSTAAVLLQQSKEGLHDLLLAILERCSSLYLQSKSGDQFWQTLRFMPDLLRQGSLVLGKIDRATAFDALLFFSAAPRPWHYSESPLVLMALDVIRNIPPKTLTEGERHVLHRWRCLKMQNALLGRSVGEPEWVSEALDDRMCFALVPGEAFSDRVNVDLTEMNPAERAKWLRLFEEMMKATGSRPSEKWALKARECVKEIGNKKVNAALVKWLPLAAQPRPIKLLEGEFAENALINDDNATALRGLLWLSPEVASADLTRTVGALTASCYRKVKGVGPRCVKVGNAGVYALSQMNDPLAVGQLALLKIKVKFGTAQKEIEKAFNQAAERSGLPREELEEMAVPTYGLTEVGVGEEEFGDFTARLKITGTDSTEVEWMGKDGKRPKAVPAAVKEKFGKEWKEFQGQAKDIQKMLPAQRERLDGMFLQERVWEMGKWRERYLEHPLVGTLARRIIWELGEGEGIETQRPLRPQRGDAKKARAGIWWDGRLVDLDLREIVLREGMSVRLWHPIGKSLEEVQAWRGFLEERGIAQPFKQAHRETYLLTEAEFRTGTYSNRFAAHVLKQHQFNALCAARGWKNQLRLMVDAEYGPPTLFLPRWGLRAEFWVEGIGEEFGTDTAESGAYLRLSTDQVRFYRIDAAQRAAHAGGGGYGPGHREVDAEPMALADVPALVFSEVMRDVDLFVGVSSVGNDPTWSDGGPNGRFVDYWQSYSFGELNASAKTRREVLERLVPKLKIGKVCSFEEKFLVVKGSLRTYKIHLGSGNILMKPNDQYLCIVPKQGVVEEGGGGVMLPFEGDRTLSVILSKAFLLAEDGKIKDGTILSQIQGGR